MKIFVDESDKTLTACQFDSSRNCPQIVEQWKNNIGEVYR